MMTSDDLRQFLETSWSASPLLSDWFRHCQESLGHGNLDDDFTMVRVRF